VRACRVTRKKARRQPGSAQIQGAAIFNRRPTEKGDFKSPLLEAQWQLRAALEFD
jgi:hypothetical protein